MIEQPFKEVVEKLIDATKRKMVKWERTRRDSEFKVVLGSSKVTTDNWVLENGNECVDLGFWNSKGELAKHVAFENNTEEGNDYKALLELYTLAKNSYFQVDDTIAEILNHLDDIKD